LAQVSRASRKVSILALTKTTPRQASDRAGFPHHLEPLDGLWVCVDPGTSRSSNDTSAVQARAPDDKLEQLDAESIRFKLLLAVVGCSGPLP